MKRNFKFIAAAIAAVAMIGCAKDNGEKIDSPKGTETTASFRITLPAATRALDVTASGDESNIEDAWVFIFDPITERLVTKVELECAIDGTSASRSGVTTTTGAKNIFVAVNAADIFSDFDDIEFPIDDETIPKDGITMAAFFAKYISATADLPTTAKYFLMTGYNNTANFVTPTATVPEPAANKVNIGVGRGVAKINMEDGHGITTTTNPLNVTVVSLKYKVINNPVDMHAFQKYDPATKTGTIVNRITGDGTIRSNYFRTPATYYDQSNAGQAGFYIPENWNDNSTTHNASALLIQGVVNINVPVLDASGVAVTYSNGADFYRVWDKTNSEWLPEFYSETPTEATIRQKAGIFTETILSAVTPAKKYEQVTPGTREFFIAKYTAAQAYWTLPLTNSSLERSVVRRNDYFYVTIKTIAQIGASSDDENAEDGILPKDPEDVDKTKVDIEAKITILNWNGVSQDGNI